MGEMKCKCKAGSMWTNGNDPLSCDKEECPKRCGMAADGVANGVCVLGVCKSTTVSVAMIVHICAHKDVVDMVDAKCLETMINHIIVSARLHGLALLATKQLIVI